MKYIIILLLLVSNLYGQGLPYTNYTFQKDGITFYALPKPNASIIDYWARKGIKADEIMSDMSSALTFHQNNSDILFKKLQECIELSDKTYFIIQEKDAVYNELVFKHTTLQQSFDAYKLFKKEQTAVLVIFGVGALLTFLITK